MSDCTLNTISSFIYPCTPYEELAKIINVTSTSILSGRRCLPFDLRVTDLLICIGLLQIGRSVVEWDTTSETSSIVWNFVLFNIVSLHYIQSLCRQIGVFLKWKRSYAAYKIYPCVCTLLALASLISNIYVDRVKIYWSHY